MNQRNRTNLWAFLSKNESVIASHITVEVLQVPMFTKAKSAQKPVEPYIGSGRTHDPDSRARNERKVTPIT